VTAGGAEAGGGASQGSTEAEGDGSRRLRRIGDLRVEIDLTLCVGFGDCVDVAPDSFELDGEGVAAFVNPEEDERARLLEACRSCPVDAITVHGDDGELLVP